MRAHSWTLSCLSVCALGACSIDVGHGSRDDDDSSSGFTSSTPSRSRPDLECAPRAGAWDQVQWLYDTTEESVHELITCGGLQVKIASDIVSMVIASNEDLFKDEERIYVEQYIGNPFAQQADGTWSMTIPDRPGSTFALSFYDPKSGELITEDVFDLDSYLAGVHIQTSVGFAQMVQEPDRKHAFVVTYDGEGPLAYLMNGGEPLPEDAVGFELQLSLNDLMHGTPSSFGPFASLFAIEADSLVSYVDQRSDVSVEYLVRTRRDHLEHIAASQSLAFDVEHLQANDAVLSLDGDASDLTFVRLGALAGSIAYSVRGELEADPVEIDVTSDFGAGEPYPETEWSCPSAD
jgi:hypothetical protein